MGPDEPLSFFYALFRPGTTPGSGDFLGCELGVAAERPLTKSGDDRAVHLFSTKARAIEFQVNNEQAQSYTLAALTPPICREMLLEGKAHGIHQHVAFNADTATSKVFPISQFVEVMSSITLKDTDDA